MSLATDAHGLAQIGLHFLIREDLCTSVAHPPEQTPLQSVD